ncbi:MAG TPA: hypothetical protein VG869_12500 [Acidimicrobiia bacterium]|jgi:hypothetical protein|nr:hypothetical protein [Acidimicrobiia bacterium]
MAEFFAPTHVIPAGGLPAWAVPDPGEPAVATLDPGLAVELLERRDDGWARVACSNGWSAWVDGRRLGVLTGLGAPAPADAAPTAPLTEPIVGVASTAWSPTHLAPAAGLSAWRDPDPASAPTEILPPGLAVRLLERRDDGWARVACSNGWSAWVDGGALVVGRDQATSTSASRVLASWQFAAGAVLFGGGVVIVVLGVLGAP